MVGSARQLGDVTATLLFQHSCRVSAFCHRRFQSSQTIIKFLVEDIDVHLAGCFSVFNDVDEATTMSTPDFNLLVTSSVDASVVYR